MSDALTTANDDRLEQIAVEIETIQGVALLKVGERLLEAQELFRYQRDEQGFGGWVDRRLRFGQTTAYKLINVFAAFGGESVHKVDTLPKAVLYALAEPSTPPSLRAKALDMVKPGEPVDGDALASLKRDLAEAKQAAKDAKRDERMQKEVAQKANEDRARMLRDYEWEKSRANTLADEVERLKQDNVLHVYPRDRVAPQPEPEPRKASVSLLPTAAAIICDGCRRDLDELVSIFRSEGLYGLAQEIEAQRQTVGAA